MWGGTSSLTKVYPCPCMVLYCFWPRGVTFSKTCHFQHLCLRFVSHDPGVLHALSSSLPLVVQGFDISGPCLSRTLYTPKTWSEQMTNAQTSAFVTRNIAHRTSAVFVLPSSEQQTTFRFSFTVFSLSDLGSKFGCSKKHSGVSNWLIVWCSPWVFALTSSHPTFCCIPEHLNTQRHVCAQNRTKPPTHCIASFTDSPSLFSHVHLCCVLIQTCFKRCFSFLVKVLSELADFQST